MTEAAPSSEKPELPKYKSHKIVQAAKIHAISEGVYLVLLDKRGNHIKLNPSDSFWKHFADRIATGMYFVIYEDGYESISPASAFEDGYLAIEPQRIVLPYEEVEAIAAVCHDANRAYCASIGDSSQLPWNQAPVWQRESAMNGVRFHLSNPTAGPEGSHRNWMKEKLDLGWVYGATKDPNQKRHPCLVPFSQLPPAQQMKDKIFVSIVRTLSGHATDADREQVARVMGVAPAASKSSTTRTVSLSVPEDDPMKLRYHQPKDLDLVEMRYLRLIYRAVAGHLSNVLPVGRELSIALTHLETSCMYAIKSVAVQGQPE